MENIHHKIEAIIAAIAGFFSILYNQQEVKSFVIAALSGAGYFIGRKLLQIIYHRFFKKKEI